uniref:Uncharacterized protein n=1 Tax=Arundo donax TaxID=35708 RepID=A0A0A9CUP1_ARUDO
MHFQFHMVLCLRSFLKIIIKLGHHNWIHMFIQWTPMPMTTLSAPHIQISQSLHRLWLKTLQWDLAGFCAIGMDFGEHSV